MTIGYWLPCWQLKKNYFQKRFIIAFKGMHGKLSALVLLSVLCALVVFFFTTKTLRAQSFTKNTNLLL